MKTKEEIVNIIGKDTMLKFDFASEGVAKYRTLTPKDVDNSGDVMNSTYVYYQIEFFINSGRGGKELFCYDTLSGFLDQYQIFEVYEIPMEQTEDKELLYHEKYKGGQDEV